MKSRLAVFVFALASATLLFGPGAARGQVLLSEPAFALRTGALEARGAGGLAPYAEAQATARFGDDRPLGLALYGGASYAHRSASYRICPVAPPCFDEKATSGFLDLATGVRLGWFPQDGPVHVFAGFASHVVRQGGERTRWPWYSTVEVGADARWPLTERLGAEVGVRGFLPAWTGETGSGPPRLRTEDMRRYGLVLGVQYDL